MNKSYLLYSSGDIQKADRCAIDNLGIPSEILMENAGRACADRALSMTSPKDRVCVLAGTGNNGGDGMVAARHLHCGGREVRVLLAGKAKAVKGAAGLNCRILKALGIPCVELSDMADGELEEILSHADLLIDALLGTGAKGSPRGDVLRALRAMKGKSPIMALDGPTGVNLDDGTVPGEAVTADLTVTMIGKKIGHAVFPGRLHCGKVESVHIGVDGECILPEPTGKATFSVSQDYVRENYPATSSTAHKGSRGGVLLVAGSPRYPGAAALASMGALRGGAGLAVLAAPEAVRPYAASMPEVIFEPLESPGGIGAVFDRWKKRCSALVLGPGLDRTEFSKQVFASSMEFWNGNTVVDGDGLYFLKEWPAARFSGGLVITPHEGEASWLMDCSSEAVSARRLEAADRLGEKYGVCLLKGPGSIISGKTLRAIEPWSSPVLAVPGSGDVLSGLIGALMSRGCRPFNGAALAGWIHGKIGHDLLERSPDGFLASQIAHMIPEILGEIAGAKT